MLRQSLLAAVALGAMMAAAPRAEAVVTYTLVDKVETVPNAIPGLPGSFALSFAVSDAAVARGTFQLSGRGSFSDPPIFSGNVADFVSLSIVGGEGTATRFPGRIEFSATFAPDRSVSSFGLNTLIDDGEAILTGSGNSLISGSFGNGTIPCNSSASSGRCQVSGRLTEVPEPMSIALLGVGLLGMLALAQRQF